MRIHEFIYVLMQLLTLLMLRTVLRLLLTRSGEHIRILVHVYVYTYIYVVHGDLTDKTLHDFKICNQISKRKRY